MKQAGCARQAAPPSANPSSTLPCVCSDGKWTVIGSRKDLYHAGTGQFAGYMYAEVRWHAAVQLFNWCLEMAALEMGGEQPQHSAGMHEAAMVLPKHPCLPQAHDPGNSRIVFTDASNTTCEAGGQPGWASHATALLRWRCCAMRCCCMPACLRCVPAFGLIEPPSRLFVWHSLGGCRQG